MPLQTGTYVEMRGMTVEIGKGDGREEHLSVSLSIFGLAAIVELWHQKIWEISTPSYLNELLNA